MKPVDIDTLTDEEVELFNEAVEQFRTAVDMTSIGASVPVRDAGGVFSEVWIYRSDDDAKPAWRVNWTEGRQFSVVRAYA